MNEREPIKKDEPDPLKDPASGEPEPPHKDVEDVDAEDGPTSSDDPDELEQNPPKQSER